MTAIQEFLIQSNLPVLVLTITIVCIVVLGYLEYRNIVDRFDMLENRFESLTKKVKKDIESFESNNNSKETSPTMKDENVEGKEDSVDDKEDTIEVKVDGKEDVSSPKENKKENVLSQLPTSLERMDPVQAMFSSMAGAGMMRGPSVMMNIPSSGNTFNEFKFEEEQILSETGSHVSEKDNKIEEDFEKLKDSKGNDKGKEEEHDDSYSEESYTDSEEDEKDEKVEKVDVKKININDGMSVSELKAICKSKNLSVSGNKAQLIERINSK